MEERVNPQNMLLDNVALLQPEHDPGAMNPGCHIYQEQSTQRLFIYVSDRGVSLSCFPL